MDATQTLSNFHRAVKVVGWRFLVRWLSVRPRVPEEDALDG
jgi:hypothetical protein